MRVVFTQFYEGYEPGDQATLDAELAAKLVKQGVCAPEPVDAAPPKAAKK